MEKIIVVSIILIVLILFCSRCSSGTGDYIAMRESQNAQTETSAQIGYVEKYYDDFFKSTPNVGEHVKIHAFTSQKYKYSSGDIQGILTKDITKKYNLALNSLGCCVMHEETKDDAVPSYYGKHIYIMFEKDAELNLDSFKTGQNVIVYGEIIKNDNGIFVLPKYIEEE